MNSEDRQQQISSPPHHQQQQQHHHHHLLRHQNRFRRMVALVYKTFSEPRAYFILLVLSFALGYLSHSQPLLSQGANDIIEHNSFPSQCANPIPSPIARQTILDRVFNGISPWQDFPPPHVSSLLWQEWIKGWGSNAPVFERLINQVQPSTIIEVGTFLGASATHMAGLTQKLGLKTLILCIDDFRGWPGYYDGGKSIKMVNGDSLLLYQFMQNVDKVNATESILFLPFSTSTALRGLCEWGVYGDLVEVDAAHDFHSAWIDINNAYKVLRPGGVLFGHDYPQPGVRKAVHSFASLHGFRVRRDGKHWILY